MKKFFAYLIFGLAVLNAHAQSNPLKIFSKDPIIHLENFDKQRVHWGYFLGFNFYDYKFDYKVEAPDIIVDRTTGFNVGLIGDLRLSEAFHLRFEPGLYYTQRNLTYPELTRPADRTREVGATYIHMPFLLKFCAVRTGNIRPYLVGGFSNTMNLASNSKSLDDNKQGRFRVKRMTQNYEVGFGIDLYLEYFKFSPSIRGVFGMGNELIPDADPNSPWTGNVYSMQTRAVLINFAFH